VLSVWRVAVFSGVSVAVRVGVALSRVDVAAVVRDGVVVGVLGSRVGVSLRVGVNPVVGVPRGLWKGGSVRVTRGVPVPEAVRVGVPVLLVVVADGVRVVRVVDWVGVGSTRRVGVEVLLGVGVLVGVAVLVGVGVVVDVGVLVGVA